MSAFTPLKGDCPVCDGARKDCRRSKSTKNIHCRSLEANPTGLRFLGEDKLGFGIWTDKPDPKELSEGQREQWRREQKLKRQERLEAEKRHRSQLLSVDERDREIRKLLAQLGLNQTNRQDLLRRGLTPEQIRLGQFCSVEQWQKLDTEVSHRLAGVNITGRGLTNLEPGYLVPIWNPKEQVVGWQLRLDNLDNGGKYRWPTSAGRARSNGPTAHLPNGELPITCCRPASEPKIKDVGLVEGILKPYITAQLRSQIVLGAAGGNFASSPQTFKIYLEALGVKQLVLYPDAGAVQNPHVLRQYRRTYNLLRGWGYELRVSWWNQLTKDDLDIDELLAAGRAEEIEIVTWAQFEAIARNPNREINNLLEALKRRVDKIFKGFGKPPKPSTPKPLPKFIEYGPGSLPTPGEYQKLGSPTIRFAEGQRIELLAELTALGYHDIWDSSLTGGGKSWDSGLVTPERLGCDRIWLFAGDHRNSGVRTTEANFRDLTVRNNGLIADSSRKTALGRDFLRWPQAGEETTVAGNCVHTKDFHLLSQKGYRHQVEESGLNPVCGNCNFKDTCGSVGALPGASYRQDRRDDLGSPRLRLSVESAPNPDDITKSFPNTGAFWDEVGRILKATELVEANLADFDQTFAQLESKLPGAHEALKPLRLALRPLLAGEIKPTQATFHGWNDTQIRELLGTPPEGLSQGKRISSPIDKRVPRRGWVGVNKQRSL